MKQGNTKLNNVNLSTLVSLVLVIFSAFYFYQSFEYDYWYGYGPGAGFTPRWTSSIMLILCIIAFVQSFKEDGIKVVDTLPKGEGWINIFIAIISMIFFVLFAKKIGFIITSTIMLTVLFGRSQKWYKAFIFGLVLTLICFYIFKILLKVPVPVNRLGY